MPSDETTPGQRALTGHERLGVGASWRPAERTESIIGHHPRPRQVRLHSLGPVTVNETSDQRHDTLTNRPVGRKPRRRTEQLLRILGRQPSVGGDVHEVAPHSQPAIHNRFEGDNDGGREIVDVDVLLMGNFVVQASSQRGTHGLGQPSSGVGMAEHYRRAQHHRLGIRVIPQPAIDFVFEGPLLLGVAEAGIIRPQRCFFGERDRVVDIRAVDGSRRQHHHTVDSRHRGGLQGSPDQADLVVDPGRPVGFAGGEVDQHRRASEESGEVGRGHVDAMHGEVPRLGYSGRKRHRIESQDAPVRAVGELGDDATTERPADPGDRDRRGHARHSRCSARATHQTRPRCRRWVCVIG